MKWTSFLLQLESAAATSVFLPRLAGLPSFICCNGILLWLDSQLCSPPILFYASSSRANSSIIIRLDLLSETQISGSNLQAGIYCTWRKMFPVNWIFLCISIILIVFLYFIFLFSFGWTKKSRVLYKILNIPSERRSPNSRNKIIKVFDG